MASGQTTGLRQALGRRSHAPRQRYVSQTVFLDGIVRDSERLRGAARQEGGPAAFDDCARDRRQGITVGWADPLDLLTEFDEEDNTSAVAIRIRGTEVARLTGRSC